MYNKHFAQIVVLQIIFHATVGLKTTPLIKGDATSCIDLEGYSQSQEL